MPRQPTPRNDLLPGDLRLLHDLAVLQVAMDGDRTPARKRLERALGADFARTVCSTLAGPEARAA